MTKRAFDKIKEGLDEALVVAPHVAEIERLREENARLWEVLKQCEQALQAESTYHADERWLYLIDGDKANAACAAAAAIREGGEKDE